MVELNNLSISLPCSYKCFWILSCSCKCFSKIFSKHFHIQNIRHPYSKLHSKPSVTAALPVSLRCVSTASSHLTRYDSLVHMLLSSLFKFSHKHDDQGHTTKVSFRILNLFWCMTCTCPVKKINEQALAHNLCIYERNTWLSRFLIS